MRDLPDDEIRRRILAILDRCYEEDVSSLVSPDSLAEELDINRAAVDRHVESLHGRGLVRTTGPVEAGHYYVAFTPRGKDAWDRMRGDQSHLVLRRRILEELKKMRDEGWPPSGLLASRLDVGSNTVCIDLLALEEDGLVELQEMGGGITAYIVHLTDRGLAELERPTVDINFCFVLMPFEDKFDVVWESGIKPAIEECGMRCARADKVRDNREVVEKVKRSIQMAGILVADVTGGNPNVLYETGYAHASQKECILITQDPRETAPFDVRHLDMIRYGATEQGLARLRRELRETIMAIRSRDL